MTCAMRRTAEINRDQHLTMLVLVVILMLIGIATLAALILRLFV